MLIESNGRKTIILALIKVVPMYITAFSNSLLLCNCLQSFLNNYLISLFFDNQCGIRFTIRQDRSRPKIFVRDTKMVKSKFFQTDKPSYNHIIREEFSMLFESFIHFLFLYNLINWFLKRNQAFPKTGFLCHTDLLGSYGISVSDFEEEFTF